MNFRLSRTALPPSRDDRVMTNPVAASPWTDIFAAQIGAIRGQLDAGIKEANAATLREAAAGIVKLAEAAEAAQVPDLEPLQRRAELDAVKRMRS